MKTLTRGSWCGSKQDTRGNKGCVQVMKNRNGQQLCGCNQDKSVNGRRETECQSMLGAVGLVHYHENGKKQQFNDYV